jgi:serine phosphatase RsbU (regulator of sigma subunit)
MFAKVSRAVETGVPFVAHRLAYTDTLDDGTTIEGFWSVQIVRFGDGYLAASRDVTEVVRLEEAEREARRIADRERLAVQILQKAALPSALPRLDGLELRAVYEPAAETQPVGGDWFDAFVLGPDRVALVIADVAGHGPEAATFMVQVRNIFRAVAVEWCGPDEVLRRVNDVTVGLHDPAGLFVTACYATLDVATGALSWAAAGHPPPLLCGKGFLEQVPGLPLSIAAGATYQVQHAELSPGSRLLLYTDGLVERRDEPIDDGLDRLDRLAGAAAHLSPSAAVQHLVDAVGSPGDDLALLLVELGT